MTALSGLMKTASLTPFLQHLNALWHGSDHPDRSLVTRADTAWQIASLSGLLRCLGGDPAAAGTALFDAALHDTVIAQLDVAPLSHLWRELELASDELDTLVEQRPARDEDVLLLEEHVEHLAERWVLERDEVERVVVAIASLLDRANPRRVQLGQLSGQLAELDAQVLDNMELLFPAIPLCRGMQKALTDAGVPFSRHDKNRWWWWFEVARQRDALETEPLLEGYRAPGPMVATPADLQDLFKGLLELTAPQPQGSFAHLICPPPHAFPGHVAFALAAGGAVPPSPAHEALEGRTWQLGAERGTTVCLELSEDGANLALVAVDADGCPSTALAGRAVSLVDDAGDVLAQTTFEGVQAVLPLGHAGISLLAKGQLRLDS